MSSGGSATGGGKRARELECRLHQCIGLLEVVAQAPGAIGAESLAASRLVDPCVLLDAVRGRTCRVVSRHVLIMTRARPTTGRSRWPRSKDRARSLRLRVRDQGPRPMSGRAGGGKLAA